MEKYMNLFEGLSVDEINDKIAEIREAATASKKAIRDALKATVKAEKEAKKAEATEKSMEYLKGIKEGTLLNVMLKGEVVEGSFVKVNAKTFTVIVDGVKKPVGFDKLILEAVEESVAV
jgi:hypothetical protein